MSGRHPLVHHPDIHKSSARLRQRQIEAIVHNSIQPGICHDIIKFVDDAEPSLQGEKRPETVHEWYRDMTYLCLYHVITGHGFNQIAFDLEYPYMINHNSLGYNIMSIRKVLGDWGAAKIKPGNLAAWKLAASDCNLPPSVNDTLLWIDSTDVQIEGRRKFSKKSSEWSYKLNAPGVRYMTVRDGDGCFVNVWGGYSPKVHDGTFLDICKSEFLRLFDGSCIIGDNHFSRGKKIFKNRIKFHTNYAIRTKEKKRLGVDEDCDYVDNITKANQKYNSDHQDARARVENPFGWAKEKFPLLDSAWRESVEHLDHMMLFSFGLYNVIRRGL